VKIKADAEIKPLAATVTDTPPAGKHDHMHH